MLWDFQANDFRLYIFFFYSICVYVYVWRHGKSENKTDIRGRFLINSNRFDSIPGCVLFGDFHFISPRVYAEVGHFKRVQSHQNSCIYVKTMVNDIAACHFNIYSREFIFFVICSY